MRRIPLLLPALIAFLAGASPAHAWTWPADGPVLQHFRFGENPYAAGLHRGIDVGGPPGTAVRAPASGSVSFAGTVPGGGRTITIRTEDGYAVTLLHLGSILARRGATVAEGEPVGTLGSSGTPEHAVPAVHLGIRVASEPEGYLDPLGFLPPRTEPAPVPPPAPEAAAEAEVPATPPPAVEAEAPATPAPEVEAEAPAPAAPEAAGDAAVVVPIPEAAANKADAALVLEAAAEAGAEAGGSARADAKPVATATEVRVAPAVAAAHLPTPGRASLDSGAVATADRPAETERRARTSTTRGGEAREAPASVPPQTAARPAPASSVPARARRFEPPDGRQRLREGRPVRVATPTPVPADAAAPPTGNGSPLGPELVLVLIALAGTAVAAGLAGARRRPAPARERARRPVPGGAPRIAAASERARECVGAPTAHGHDAPAAANDAERRRDELASLREGAVAQPGRGCPLHGEAPLLTPRRRDCGPGRPSRTPRLGLWCGDAAAAPRSRAQGPFARCEPTSRRSTRAAALRAAARRGRRRDGVVRLRVAAPVSRNPDAHEEKLAA